MSPLTYQGNSPKSITYNGSAVKTVTYNGTVIWTATTPISDLSVGTLIQVNETGGNVWYRLMDKAYLGNALLVRENLTSTTKFWSSTPANASANKYDGSTLDQALITYYSRTIPAATKTAIKTVSIPVRQHANTSTQAYLSRQVFCLSATEWGLSGSAAEGVAVAYTSNRSSTAIYWTREPVGGMANYCYSINTDGTRRNSGTGTALNMRPAFCVATSQPTEEISGGYALVV